MEMTAAISLFLTHVKVEKGLSANTVAAYQRDLAKFNAFVQKRKLTLESVSRDDLVDFLAGLYRESWRAGPWRGTWLRCGIFFASHRFRS